MIAKEENKRARLPIDRVSPQDEPAILALNNAHAAELSWLEPERLSFLLGEAFYARRIGALEAFIMTFDQDARYDSPNFLWFRERYPRFVMSTASSLREKRVAAAMPGGSMRICSTMSRVPARPSSPAR